MKPLPLMTLTHVSRFFRWWIQELRSTAYDARTLLTPHWRKQLTIYASRSQLQVRDGDSLTSAALFDVTRPDPGSAPAPVLSEEQRGMLAADQRVCLVLDPELAFLQSLRMPLAAVPYLDSAIDLQMPKLLPVSASLLRTDFEITEIDAASGHVEVEIAAIKRVDVEQIERDIEQWGLRVTSIHLGRASEARTRFKLGATDTRGSRVAITRTDSVLGLTAAALAVCVILVFSVQALRAQKTLGLALEQTSAKASAVLEQRQNLISQLETLSLVSQLERTPTAAAILGDLTSHLGKDAWLTTFELKGRDLRLVGLSPEPATVVKELAGSPLIDDVQLRSSNSAAGANGGKDRFEITAQVKAIP